MPSGVLRAPRGCHGTVIGLRVGCCRTAGALRGWHSYTSLEPPRSLRCQPSVQRATAVAVTSGELLYRPLWQVAQAIESRELSPLELVRAQLERIERLDAKLGSY